MTGDRADPDQGFISLIHIVSPDAQSRFPQPNHMRPFPLGLPSRVVRAWEWRPADRAVMWGRQFFNPYAFEGWDAR